MDQILDRSPLIATPALSLALDLSPRRLPELVAAFQATEALDLPDIVLPLSDLRMTLDGTLAVPGTGEFQLNDWSRRQLSSSLGIKWDTWFSTTHPEERAEEVNRRFGRHEGRVRLRTRAHADEARHATTGILRAFVAPTFSPISDVLLGELLADALGSDADAARVFRDASTDKTTSYVLQLGEPFHVGQSAEVGNVFGGLLVRNSDVGYASLVVVTHLTRIVCLNGMVAPVPDALVLKKRHIGIARDALAARIHDGLAGLTDRIHRGASRLDAARGIRVDNMTNAIHEVLESAHLPRRLSDPILRAYGVAPHASVFGLVQAITRVAREETPELRVDLEQAAARWIAKATT